MAYFNVCPDCGAHLDPSERCDCTEDKPSIPAMQRATAETARITPPRAGLHDRPRYWVGKPGPKPLTR